ncbi:1-deoxy-D-xylulose-5-phosphate reductoisomerase [uncultured Adlercreutzia sp.]|uniref:1-deoxy-D-xylulose-5-phosphate reductoisomerase n=1 Tax=uncultured Adlercreutzia sp. TaxID=875803 RepID=UPI0025EAE9CE|nr:1-deoxy-D-xylulose-5-phosphate reductoisomerase [uncultured Adlercreutzia sp.]MCI9262521.1 1-deoxy-D-xylulose-5-phosphate reductoisomerase [Eggerthellaceae bacterium]
MAKRRIVVLGSTGSIGTQTLDVVRQHSDQLEVVGLAVHSRIDTLLAQAREFDVCHLAVGDEALANDPRIDEARQLTARLAASHSGDEGTVGVGPAAVLDLVRLPDVDVVVNALVGAAGLRASYETLAQGKVLALANKESLVVGGDLIMPLAAQVDEARRAAGLAPATGPAGALMPIDSEHGAIYQCLLGENPREVSKLWVTASGGPFRGKTRDELRHITPAQALAHPTWNMGAKISIDSSTLMNKGLEVIEAHHLFAMPYDKIEVVVQPQSAIHSMVEFTDGSVKAHLGTTDMRIPIQFALSYPDRWEAPVAPLDFRTLGTLEFAAPDTHTFRCLALAREAGRQGGTLPCVMNAANEVAVAEFLAGSISYLDIAACVEAAMEAQGSEPVESLEQLEEVDARTRVFARAWCGTHPLL